MARRLRDDDRLVGLVRARLACGRQRSKARARARELVEPPSLWRWAPLVLGVIGGLTVVTVGTAAVDHWTAPRLGEACHRHRDCGTGEFCLQHLPVGSRYCSAGCDADADCPRPMRCGDLATLPEAERGVGAVGPAGTASACIER
jgi:hypothetical protein